jgi:hypothetical protein
MLMHLVRNNEVDVQLLSIIGIALVAPDVSPSSFFVSVVNANRCNMFVLIAL